MIGRNFTQQNTQCSQVHTLGRDSTDRSPANKRSKTRRQQGPSNCGWMEWFFVTDSNIKTSLLCWDQFSTFMANMQLTYLPTATSNKSIKSWPIFFEEQILRQVLIKTRVEVKSKNSQVYMLTERLQMHSDLNCGLTGKIFQRFLVFRNNSPTL